jgi:hypothetical protein
VKPLVRGIIPNGCKTSVKRLKEGPAVWSTVINEGVTYTDTSFEKRNMLYSWPSDDWIYSFKFQYDIFWGNAKFDRLGEAYSSNTMWGANGIDFMDPSLGRHESNYRNSYILAAMGAIAEFPDIVKDVFLTKEVNDEGIYAVKLFIRGKPWILTVDDTILRFKGGTPYFSHIGDYMWVPILEKAWAKMKGTYVRSSGGFGGGDFLQNTI